MKNSFLTAVCAGLLLTTACNDNAKEQTDPIADPSNLTEGNQYANSFIVEEAGDYRFTPCHVDGSAIEGITSADWVWSTNDVLKEGLIENVRYETGEIHFTALKGKGNALIAALDGKGNIIWSWHLWLTEKPLLQKLDNGTLFMDRNLGAMSAKPNDQSLTYGLKYQWGRKDPFYGGALNESAADQPFVHAVENTVVNPHFNATWNSVQLDERIGSVEYAIRNPMTFIYATTDQRDWMFKRNDNLWCNPTSGGKTNYDPCPAGYAVPKEGAWEGCNFNNVLDDPENGGRIHTTAAGEKFWWPLSGTRWGDKDAGRLGYAGKGGSSTFWIRSTEKCGFNASCFYIHQGTYVSSSYAMYRAHGVSVRCTKEP